MSLCSSQSAWPCSSSPEMLDARGLGWCITWHEGETWGLIENKTNISPKDLKNQSKIPCWGHSFILGGVFQFDIIWLLFCKKDWILVVKYSHANSKGMEWHCSSSSLPTWLAVTSIFFDKQKQQPSATLRIDYCIPSYFPNCIPLKILKKNGQSNDYKFLRSIWLAALAARYRKILQNHHLSNHSRPEG